MQDGSIGTELKSRAVGVGLVVVGALFLFVTNHILIGWEHVWPLFPVGAGVLLLRIHRSSRNSVILFAGLVCTLLGLFLFLFSARFLPWFRMETLWPWMPLLAGLSLLAASAAGHEGGTPLLVSAGVILFAVVAFLFTTGKIGPRVSEPVVRLWPLVLITAGIVILRTRHGAPRESRADSGMEAIRRVMDAGDEPSREAPPGDQILRRVEAAGNTRAATRALVSELRARFPRFAWVGVYRVEGDRLTLDPDEYVGHEPEYKEIALGDGICGASAREGRSIVVPDVCKDERYLACSPTVKSEIVVPVLADGRVIGVLDIDSDELDAFGEKERAFLEALVADAAPHIHEVQLRT